MSDIVFNDEDIFDFGRPVQPPQVTPPPRVKIEAQSPRLPVQERFSTLFATSDDVAMPKESRITVVPRLHPLAKARKAVNLSQKMLAKRSGVSLLTIKRLEAGLTNPKLSTLRKLAFTLCKPIDAIIDN